MKRRNSCADLTAPPTSAAGRCRSSMCTTSRWPVLGPQLPAPTRSTRSLTQLRKAPAVVVAKKRQRSASKRPWRMICAALEAPV